MKVLLLLWLCWLTDAQEKTYLITAPKLLRVDASERVVVQLTGYSAEAKVRVTLKDRMGAGPTIYAEEDVTLNAKNQYGKMVTLRILAEQFPEKETHAYLHVLGDFSDFAKIPVTRTNGFIFIQTDKPLYTPEQSVKVRAFSYNEELKPATRLLRLTFRDPERQEVQISDLTDVNGVPNMQDPFIIPLKPKLGMWTIEASYAKHFTTKAKVAFEVKEYVLPSISITMQPEAAFISYGTFEAFRLKITARYVSGAPVADAEVYYRFGLMRGNTPEILPKTIRRDLMSDRGEVDVTLNVKAALQDHDMDPDLSSVAGRLLYLIVMVQETTGGISQEAELASVQFVKSPYTLSLVATPLFIKPGLPYNLMVVVKDPRGGLVAGVGVRVAEAQLRGVGGGQERLDCSGNSVTSDLQGIAFITCNIPDGASDTPGGASDTAHITFKSSDPLLPESGQAVLSVRAEAYSSPNQRYLYIQLAPSAGLEAGQTASMKVYFHARKYISINTFSYQIISKGKIQLLETQQHTGSDTQVIHFVVRPEMAPSVRLLVYYTVYAEGVAELVADSVWINVNDPCVNGLKTELSMRRRSHKPNDTLRLEVVTGREGLVAMAAVDTALYSLRTQHLDPVTQVLRQVEQSDLGCGGGGGRDNADVFRLAGLTFLTNANARAAAPADDSCTAVVRPKRAAQKLDRIIKEKIQQYEQRYYQCCIDGMKASPILQDCAMRAEQVKHANLDKDKKCIDAFTSCCRWFQKLRAQTTGGLSRADEQELFDQNPTLVRSLFPESWLWEVHPVGSSGVLNMERTLPHSLTTWEVKAVGVFKEGLCVARPLQVAVTQAVSLDVPLPYSMVRGEQIQLKGSVYNQEQDTINYCVTLMAGTGVCLFQAKPSKEAGLRTTACDWRVLEGGAVGAVAFTLMALEVGGHALTFTLLTREGARDAVRKTLRVVPEGIRTEIKEGGKLDPHGLYGPKNRIIQLRHQVPDKLVPKSSVERILTINGEILGEVLSIVEDPEGLQQLLGLPRGSAEMELMRFLPLYYVYHYLQTSQRWPLLHAGQPNTRLNIQRRIREGITSINSFRHRDYSYSMWKDASANTWLTALVVKTMGQVNEYVKTDSDSQTNSIRWLVENAQQPDGSFKELATNKPVRLMGAGANAVDQSVFLTSFVMIGIKFGMKVEKCDLQIFGDSLERAANYVSQHAPGVQSVYARAVAAYALTLADQSDQRAVNLQNSLEKMAREKGNPVTSRFWQERGAGGERAGPDQTSGQTVETTAYALLTTLLRRKSGYARPILAWLTQDSHYGGGFHSTQDTILTLQAVTEYSHLVQHAALDLEIEAFYKTKGPLGVVTLTQHKPVGRPFLVKEDEDVTVETGYGTGVSVVTMKTVYYKMQENNPGCNFELTIAVHSPDLKSNEPMQQTTRVVACAKFRPPPGEAVGEARLTIMEIQLPTGMHPYQEDLERFSKGLEAVYSDYQIKGDTVILQLDSVPSDMFLCAGFRVKEAFRVGMVSASVFKVYEQQDKGNQCTRLYSPAAEKKLLRLCVAEQCHCMSAECCTFRSDMDSSITDDQLKQATCHPDIKYAFKVKVKSSKAEGDFVTYVAEVEDIFKLEQDKVVIRTQLHLVKKATCTSTDLQPGNSYLLRGANTMHGQEGGAERFRYPLDSQVTVEAWPNACDNSAPCEAYLKVLNAYAFNFLFQGC